MDGTEKKTPNFKAPKMRKLKDSIQETNWEGKKTKNMIDPRPQFSLSESDLPEVKSWSIDKEYTLIIKVDMKGIREQDYGKDKGKIVGDFRISEIAIQQAEAKK